MDGRVGAFEQLVLLAVVRLYPRAYGMAVRAEICQRTGRRVSLGAVYATLDRLVDKGFVSSADVRASDQRRGRARRFFQIEPGGQVALRNSLADIESMVGGLELEGKTP